MSRSDRSKTRVPAPPSAGAQRGALRPEDDAAWTAVTQSITPLARKRPPLPKAQPVSGAALAKPGPNAPARQPPVRESPVQQAPPPIPVPTAPKSPHVRLPPIEPKLAKAIRRGQTPIEHRLDLHGATQSRAHRLLTSTLAAARLRGQRIVLIVTGTGVRRRLLQNESAPVMDSVTADTAPGVLKRMLPHWLAEPPVSAWILGVSPAAPHHGGAGAVYVVLRRACPD